MLSWWDSLEAVTNLTWWLKWIGASLTIVGGLCVIATLVSSKREETLKNKRDGLKQEQTESNEKALRARLAAAEERQKGRRLTDEQRAKLIEVSKRYSRGPIQLHAPLNDAEAMRFAMDLRDALKEAGWDAREIITSINWFDKGLAVWVNPDKPAPHAGALQEALGKIGLEVEGVGNIGMPEDRVILFVGSKP